MSRKFVASRDCAIALTSALQEFKNSPTEKSLRKAMNHNGLSASKASAIMHCLRDMGCVTSHGKHGNKFHVNSEFRTSHVIARLHKRAVI
jgi:hypothetical protein